jgi:hypothetical protein
VLSDSVNPLVIKTALQQRTQAISNLLWNDLTPDAQDNLMNYDWQGDPQAIEPGGRPNDYPFKIPTILYYKGE